MFLLSWTLSHWNMASTTAPHWSLTIYVEIGHADPCPPLHYSMLACGFSSFIAARHGSDGGGPSSPRLALLGSLRQGKRARGAGFSRLTDYTGRAWGAPIRTVGRLFATDGRCWFRPSVRPNDLPGPADGGGRPSLSGTLIPKIPAPAISMDYRLGRSHRRLIARGPGPKFQTRFVSTARDRLVRNCEIQRLCRRRQKTRAAKDFPYDAPAWVRGWTPFGHHSHSHHAWAVISGDHNVGLGSERPTVGP